MSNTNSSEAEAAPQEQKEFFPFRPLYQALDNKLREIQEAWKEGEVSELHKLHHEAVAILIDLSHGSFILATNAEAKRRLAEGAAKDATKE